MIYYSENPITTWQPNLIMLDLEDDLGHIFVTRNTYDEAVLLSDRFDHDTDLITKRIGGVSMQEDVVSYMIAVLPAPINILAPFYHLIDSSVKIDVENMRQTIGVLSYISMSINFNTILKVPFEIRANLVFTKSILLEYQSHFEDFSFRISPNQGHILPEEKLRQVSSRSEQKDFELEDKVDESTGIDVESFLADIWGDMSPIPTLTMDPVTTTSNSSPNTVVPQNAAGTEFHKEISQEDSYQAIITKFSR